LNDGKGSTGDQQNRPERRQGPAPAVDADHIERQDQCDQRQLPPDHLPERHVRQMGHLAEHRDGNAEGAEGDGRGVKDEREGQRLERREADQDQHGTRDCDRRSETGDSFEEGAEAEADDDEHDPAVVRQVVQQPKTQAFEAARRDRDIVQQKRVYDDPHDRPERKDGTVGGGGEHEPHRQLPDEDRDHESAEKTDSTRLPRREAQNTEQEQDRRDWDRRDQERQSKVVADRRE